MEKCKYIKNKTTKKQADIFLLAVATNQGINTLSRELFFNFTTSIQRLPNTTCSKIYNYSWKTMNSDSFISINNSLVIQLAKSILQNYLKCNQNTKSNNKIKDNFYNDCIKSLFSVSNDCELFQLYLKQMTLIFKSGYIFENFSNYNLTNIKSSNNILLYMNILESFWKRTDWSRMFPSMPEAALNIRKNKHLLINLMLKKSDKFRIDHFANSFIRRSKYGKENDMLLISFLDFTIFSWFEHFGIINYIKGKDSDPVFVILTKHGRKMLEYLSLN